MAILTMPILVLALLRIAASVADARVAERSKRLAAEIDATAVSSPQTPPRDPGEAKMQADASDADRARLTEEAPRDQG